VRYHYQSSFVPDTTPTAGAGPVRADLRHHAPEAGEEALERLARIDSLTGVANRRQFEEQLSSALARRAGRARASRCCAIDVDHFKAINDNHGHPVGDAVLVEVAGRLLSCVRAGDLVARLGGDEFMVLVATRRRTAPSRSPSTSWRRCASRWNSVRT
jgi:GGDEF domain-containing protein